MFMRLRLPRRSVVPCGRFTSTPRTTMPPSARASSSSSSSSSSGASPSPTAKMDTTTSPTPDKAASKHALPLPAPPHGEQEEVNSGRGNDVTTLRVGESLRLDALGPLVVNTDGSVARVGNWAGMTAVEREATLRLLGKRNQQRLAALRAKEDETEAGNGCKGGE